MKNQYTVNHSFVKGAEENPSTTFWVTLYQFNSNNLRSEVGSMYVTLKGVYESYTSEAKAKIEQKLSNLGLVELTEIDPLVEAKRLRWMDIVAIRDDLEAKGFEYLGKTFDSDTRSVLRLLGTVQAATMAEINNAEFSVDWTTADNTVITMTKEQVLGLPLAMASSINEIHIQARELRKSLDDAGSVAEVQAVKWPGVEYEVAEAYNPFDENGDLPAELQTEANSAES